MLAYTHDPFPAVLASLRDLLLQAKPIETGEWQAQRDVPQTQMLELEDVSLRMTMPATIDALRAIVQPNLPWADDHFLERVSGKPLNPPPSAAWWPFKRKDHAEHVDEDGRFSHTYPERFWPRTANDPPSKPYENVGIRYRLGDLRDLVDLLRDRPGTRQAYLPVWFPEDLAAAKLGVRVPCTLGYHFLVREGKLSCRYYIRSCDFLRHFQDDVYLACRLAEWIAHHALDNIPLGNLVMHISSLHVFAADRDVLAYRQRRDRMKAQMYIEAGRDS